MKQQTAVEWLVKQILPIIDFGSVEERKAMREFFTKAKAMEKEQIENAYKKGMYVPSELDEYGSYKSAEQYYNETYGE